MQVDQATADWLANFMAGEAKAKQGLLPLRETADHIKSDVRKVLVAAGISVDSVKIREQNMQDQSISIYPADEPHEFDVPVISIAGTYAQQWGHRHAAKILSVAHEVGHFLRGHLDARAPQSHQIELEADEEAGRLAARLGLSETDIEDWIRSLTHPQGCATHPPHDQRLAAALKGFREGGQPAQSGWTPPSESSGFPSVGRPKR